MEYIATRYFISKFFSLIKKDVKVQLRIYDYSYYSFYMLQLHMKKLFSNKERYFILRLSHHFENYRIIHSFRIKKDFFFFLQ